MIQIGPVEVGMKDGSADASVDLAARAEALLKLWSRHVWCEDVDAKVCGSEEPSLDSKFPGWIVRGWLEHVAFENAFLPGALVTAARASLIDSPPQVALTACMILAHAGDNSDLIRLSGLRNDNHVLVAGAAGAAYDILQQRLKPLWQARDEVHDQASFAAFLRQLCDRYEVAEKCNPILSVHANRKLSAVGWTDLKVSAFLSAALYCLEHSTESEPMTWRKAAEILYEAKSIELLESQSS